MTHDPMKSAAADAAATAAAFGARSNYAKGYTDGEAQGARNAHGDRAVLKEHAEAAHAQLADALTAAESRIAVEASRADVAEARVCELRVSLAAIAAPEVDGATTPATLWMERKALAALDSTADIAGRWVSRAEHERVWDIGAQAERARDEVGIQYAAAQARIKLLEEGATLLRHIDEFKGEQKWGANGANHYHVSCDVIDIGVGCFLSALDTVPGDALAPKVRVESGPGFEVIRAIHATWAMTPSERRIMDRLMAGEFAEDMLSKMHAPPPTPTFFERVKAETLAAISEPMPVPPSPAGASVQPSGSTPAVLSVGASHSEVEGSRCGPSGTDGEPTGLRAIALSHLEALGVDTSNVKEKA